VGVVRRHVERPQVLEDLEARARRRHEEGGDAAAVAGRAEVRAKIRSCFALWMPVFHVFSPLMTQSSPSRTAVVSMWVASEPCFGSVMPKAKPPVPSSILGTHSAFCSSVPWASMSRRPTLLPTIDDSFCRSLWRPRPLRARCSRMTAMPRFVPSLPPYSFGKA
jgi:hypothetical protein